MILTSQVAKGRCPVCRAPSCGCGPITTDVQPIDLPEREESTMASKLKEYKVKVNGIETTMQLDEKDAERLGGTEVKTASKKTASNKKRTTKGED